MGDCSEINTYATTGDTILKSFKYVKIYDSKDSIVNTLNSSYFCCVRDSLHKWYFVNKDDTVNYMLFDFSVKPGDTVSITNRCLPSKSTVQVISIDSINLAGIWRKRINW